MKSKLGKLNKTDFIKTLIMFIISTVIGGVTGVLTEYLTIIQSGEIFDFMNALFIAGLTMLVTILTYIGKNLGSNSEDKILKKEKNPKSIM